MPMPEVIPRPCKECGKIIKYLRRGLCDACYRRWMRRNKPRPPRECKQCGRERTIIAHGICDVCDAARYYKPHKVICRNCGKERIEWDAELCGHCWHKLHPKIAKCKKCQQDKPIYARGMCASCYSLWFYRNKSKYDICKECNQQKPIVAHGKCMACNSRLRARKNGVCAKGSKMSSPQRAILEHYRSVFPDEEILSNHPIFTNPQTGRQIDVDIWISGQNLAIEVDGPHHRQSVFGQENLKYVQKMDALKDQLANAAGIHLIRIPV